MVSIRTKFISWKRYIGGKDPVLVINSAGTHPSHRLTTTDTLPFILWLIWRFL
ncbi:unnamed protein product, partial [Nesidiocoris tenuis]